MTDALIRCKHGRRSHKRILFQTPFILLALSTAAFGADLSVADLRVVEGDVGQRSAEITVAMSAAATGPVTVTYVTKDGTSSAGDYQAANGTLTFARGEMIKKIVNDDSGNLATYEVRLSFVGHLGSLAKAIGCAVRNNGTVVMTGLLSGIENVGRDDDIECSGILQLDVDIDLCEVHRVAGMDELCGIRIIGAGAMETELALYVDNRGGYVKAVKAPGSLLSIISGSCDASCSKRNGPCFSMTAWPTSSTATGFRCRCGRSVSASTRMVKSSSRCCEWSDVPDNHV